MGYRNNFYRLKFLTSKEKRTPAFLLAHLSKVFFTSTLTLLPLVISRAFNAAARNCRILASWLFAIGAFRSVCNKSRSSNRPHSQIRTLILLNLLWHYIPLTKNRHFIFQCPNNRTMHWCRIPYNRKQSQHWQLWHQIQSTPLHQSRRIQHVKCMSYKNSVAKKPKSCIFSPHCIWEVVLTITPFLSQIACNLIMPFKGELLRERIKTSTLHIMLYKLWRLSKVLQVQ